MINMALIYYVLLFSTYLRKFYLYLTFFLIIYKLINNFYIRETLNKYLTAIITLLLTRMKSSKTDKYTLSFVYFVCFFLAIDKEGVNPDYVIQAFDSVQHK
jgi:exportin-2 (importin alpha re-exporter)